MGQIPLWPRKNSARDIEARQDLVAQKLTEEQRRVLFEPAIPLESLGKFQECVTSHMVLPVGLVGPLSLQMASYRVSDDGQMVEEERRREDVFVPLAHSEGGLSASLLRGARAVGVEQGISTYVLADTITRASCFRFTSSEAAVALATWTQGHQEELRAWIGNPENPLYTDRLPNGLGRLSRHAVLRSVKTHVVGVDCHILYAFTTGDACGPNMITRNAYAINTDFIAPRFVDETGHRPEQIVLESNMGGDKKPSHQYFAEGHGKTVLASAFVSDRTLRRHLGTNAADLVSLEHLGLHGAHASGMQSFGFTPASAVAAVFAATGQDLGMVGTSSMAHGQISAAPGGAHFSLRLPGLEVATLGGGTELPHAQAHLALMGCRGAGKVYRLAQITAAAALCLEISAAASMASHASQNFYAAHAARGGRRLQQP